MLALLCLLLSDLDSNPSLGPVGVIGIVCAVLAMTVFLPALLDTIIVRWLLIPVILYELDDRVWWPAKMHRT